MRDGCAYNHVQPLPELTIDVTSPKVAPLISALNDALSQLTLEELAAYEAELDAEARVKKRKQRRTRALMLPRTCVRQSSQNARARRSGRRSWPNCCASSSREKRTSSMTLHMSCGRRVNVKRGSASC